MKTIKCVCETQGLLIIGKNYDKNMDGSVPSYESGLSHYELSSPESLFKIAKTYYKVERFNGNIEFGKDYTITKAKNDFKNLSVERNTIKDVAGIEYQK